MHHVFSGVSSLDTLHVYASVLFQSSLSSTVLHSLRVEIL